MGFLCLLVVLPISKQNEEEFGACSQPIFQHFIYATIYQGSRVHSYYHYYDCLNQAKPSDMMILSCDKKYQSYSETHITCKFDKSLYLGWDFWNQLYGETELARGSNQVMSIVMQILKYKREESWKENIETKKDHICQNHMSYCFSCTIPLKAVNGFPFT